MVWLGSNSGEATQKQVDSVWKVNRRGLLYLKDGNYARIVCFN